MVTLAIDASTKSSGIAVFEDQQLKYYECITASSANLYNRIDKMIEGIEKVIKDFQPTNIIIEEVLLEDIHHNNNVFKALLYLQGFIMHLLNKYKLVNNVKFFGASEWRKKCGIHTGRGVLRDSLKKKDIEFVKSQFDLTVNDDIADAICLGFAAVGGTIKQPQVIIDDSGFEFA